MLRRILMFAAFASILAAQEYRATLSGRVTDPSGSAVPGATVVATKSDTNSRFETVTGADGYFTLPLLPPGGYGLTATSKGFKTYVQVGITLGTNQRLEQNVELSIGDATQSVTIEADAPLLDAVTASTGQVMTTREVESLPVNGRSPMALAYLGFGVISNEARDQERPFENAGLSNQAIGGAATGANEMLMDGVPNTGTTGQSGLRVAYSPPVDAVSEVKVESFSVDAAYGRSGGGTISITTKGGTNTFHGTLYEYNQNSFLNATPFFTNSAGGKKTVGAQNNYGGTFGGPVRIPKVYNGKDKLFFFFGYEGWKDRAPNPVFSTVPTAAERGGNFAGLSQLYDPLSGVLTGATVNRTVFPGNVIPSSRFSKVALNYLKLLPTPNVPGNADGTFNLYSALTTSQSYHSYTGRGDYNISDRNKLSANMHTSAWAQDTSQQFGIASGETAYRTTSGAMVDDVHSFSPTVVADLRAGFSRYRPYYEQYNMGYDATQLGFPSYINSNATVQQIPQINFSDGFTQIAGGHQTNQPLNTYQVFFSITKVTSSHTLKFGGEARRYQFSQVNWTAAAGSFSFDNTWVRASSVSTATTTGSGFASFLMGLPSSGAYTLNAFSTQDSNYYAGFVNDDWHLKSNLTLNLGLRWEYSSPSRERYNRESNGFDPTATNQVSALAQSRYAANFAKYPDPKLPISAFQPVGGLTFANSDNRDSYHTPKTSFAPRIGLSWTPGAFHGTTVIRAGTGIFYYPYPVVTQPQPGYTYTNNYVPSTNSFVSPYTTLDNPYPAGILQAPGSSGGINTNLGQSISFYTKDLLNEYSFRWDLDIQRQFKQNVLIEIGYTGNHSVHLPTSQNLGAIPAQYLSRSPFRDGALITALAANVANPFEGLLPASTSSNNPLIGISNLLRAYPQFSGVTQNYVNNGSSYFHQFAARLSKRFSNGLQFMVNFQHSRLMEKNSYLNNNPGAFDLEKRVSSSDRPNRLVFSETYDMPFGRGRRFLSTVNRPVDFLLGGWQVAAIYSMQSGAMLGWGNLIYLGADLNADPRNVSKAFNTAAFNTVSAQQLASNLRTFPSQFNNLRVDITNNWDVNVTKAFPIVERVKLVYRAEAFNMTNRAQFSAPNLTPTSGGFGAITAQSNQPRAYQMSLRLVF